MVCNLVTLSIPFFANYQTFAIFAPAFNIFKALQIYKEFRHMQEVKQKISPIKQRILQFANDLGISKREFYERIGVSRGTLESPTGITEDVMTKFIATYPDVSIEWLISGKGPIIKKEENNTDEKKRI